MTTSEPPGRAAGLSGMRRGALGAGAAARQNVASMVRCPACDIPVDPQPRLRGSDRVHDLPGTFEVVVCSACGTGVTRPDVPAEELGKLYPNAYNAYALPAAPVARAAATALFHWRYWKALRRLPLRPLTEARPAASSTLAAAAATSGWCSPSEAGR